MCTTEHYNNNASKRSENPMLSGQNVAENVINGVLRQKQSFGLQMIYFCDMIFSDCYTLFMRESNINIMQNVTIM